MDATTIIGTIEAISPMIFVIGAAIGLIIGIARWITS